MRSAALRRVAVALVAGTLLAGCGGSSAPDPRPERGTAASSTPRPVPSPPRVPKRDVPARAPSIVLVLMDDFSTELLATMRHAGTMRRQGATYSNAFVVDSLCCVSRASLATGQYPHQTGVWTNTANTPNPFGPIGGWAAFVEHGNAERSVNVALQTAGYTTGFVGKFLNQYSYEPGGEIPPVPPGWTQWNAIFGNAYNGWDFDSTYVRDGLVHVRHHDAPPGSAPDPEKDRAYVGSVIDRTALRFIREHRDDRAPYFLQVSTYGTHSKVGASHYPGDPGFPPAFRDRGGEGSCGAVRCDSLGLDHLPGFGDDTSDNAPVRADGSPAPPWRTNQPRLGGKRAVAELRDRARMAQSIDRMLGRILDEVGPDTYVVLTSDNGFHLGQHGLDAGKGTPYDSDTRVPLLVVGPGVEQGERATLTSNLDLAPTFEELAGLRPPAYRAGRSLLPTLREASARHQDLVFFEHTYAPSLGEDPDKAYAGGTMDLIPSYVAVRSRDALLVRLDLDPSWAGTDHAWELYTYDSVGWERRNGYADPANAGVRQRLTRALERYDACAAFVGDDPLPPRCRAITRWPDGQ